MARAVILVLLIVAVVTINALPQGFGSPCGPNEQFTSCGSSCPGTCLNPTPLACTLACIPGCECIAGFVKNANNVCIPTQSC